MNTPTATSLAEHVDTQGYFIWENFFDVQAIDTCRSELLEKLEQDTQFRGEQGYQAASLQYPDGGLTTTLTDKMHQVLFPSAVCGSFERLWESVFSDGTIKEFLQWLTGENYRLRIEVGRRSTGTHDVVEGDDLQLPHAWHRDSKGEFTFGFLLDDMPDENSGCTTVVPGTHRLPYDPRWDLHLSGNAVTLPYFRTDSEMKAFRTLPAPNWKDMKLNREIREAYLPKRKDLGGPRGTLYFFLNDTWHGRAPNTTGKPFMLSRCGGFATDFRFKDDRPLPTILLDRQDSPYVARYREGQYVNRDRTSYFNRLMEIQQDNISKPFELARLEKYGQIYKSVSPQSLATRIANYLRK